MAKAPTRTADSPATPEESDERYCVSVSVVSRFLPGESSPLLERFVFAYTVTIRNEGTAAATLLRRRWIISDANGHLQRVEGEGVVGEQPHLKPGQHFRYTSAALIKTPAGTMHGSYAMRADDGHDFAAEIPQFGLTTPTALH